MSLQQHPQFRLDLLQPLLVSFLLGLGFRQLIQEILRILVKSIQ